MSVVNVHIDYVCVCECVCSERKNTSEAGLLFGLKATCSAVGKDKNLLWNFTACVSVVQFSVLWTKRTFRRLWFCFIALATTHNATQTLLTVWVPFLSQRLWHMLVPEMELQACFWEIAGRKPYCIWKNAILRYSVGFWPALTSSCHPCWSFNLLCTVAFLLQHSNSPETQIVVIIIIIIMLLIMIKRISAAYLWKKTLTPCVWVSVCVCVAYLKCFHSICANTLLAAGDNWSGQRDPNDLFLFFLPQTQ